MYVCMYVCMYFLYACMYVCIGLYLIFWNDPAEDSPTQFAQ